MSMSMLPSLVRDAALVRVDLYDPSVACGATMNDSVPLLSRSFPANTPLELTAPPGAYTVVVTSFADAQATTKLGSGCTSANFAPGAAVCLDITIAGVDGGTGGGSIAFVAAAQARAANATELTLQSPTGLEVGDFMVLSVAILSSGPTLAMPPGWTSISSIKSATGYQAYWFTKFAAAAEPPLTVNVSGAAELGGVIVAYRGVRSSMPIDIQSAQPTNSFGSITGNSIKFSVDAPAPTRPNDWTVAFFVYDSGGGESFLSVDPVLQKRSDIGILATFDGPAVGAQTISATATWTSSGNTADGTGFLLDLAAP